MAQQPQNRTLQLLSRGLVLGSGVFGALRGIHASYQGLEQAALNGADQFLLTLGTGFGTYLSRNRIGQGYRRWGRLIREGIRAQTPDILNYSWSAVETFPYHLLSGAIIENIRTFATTANYSSASEFIPRFLQHVYLVPAYAIGISLVPLAVYGISRGIRRII